MKLKIALALAAVLSFGSLTNANAATIDIHVGHHHHHHHWHHHYYHNHY
jgi:hypothetical protein